MAIGNTKVDIIIKRGLFLSEAVAWMNTFTNSTKEEILNWIKNDQLLKKGIDKNDEIIGYYSALTEKITKGKKKQGDPYNLYDSGDFFRSMYLTVMLDTLIINASSVSFTEMKKQRWYSDAILGLNDENFTKLKELVRESYIKYAKEVLFKF